MTSRLRIILSRATPAGRRWKRLLESRTLDIADLTSADAPEGDDFIICGAPRTGTTLMAATLHQPPRMVTLMEPWDAMAMTPREFLGAARQEIAQGGTRRGKLDLTALRDGLVAWAPEGTHRTTGVSEPFLLGVKWPAFWQLMPLFQDTRFVFTVRNPVDTVRSMKQTTGRLRYGYEYDITFNRGLNSLLADQGCDSTHRQALMWEMAARTALQTATRSNVLVVKYERWFEDRTVLVSELSDFLRTPLAPQVRIRAPSQDSQLSLAEKQTVRNVCRSAGDFGYDLS